MSHQQRKRNSPEQLIFRCHLNPFLLSLPFSWDRNVIARLLVRTERKIWGLKRLFSPSDYNFLLSSYLDFFLNLKKMLFRRSCGCSIIIASRRWKISAILQRKKFYYAAPLMKNNQDICRLIPTKFHFKTDTKLSIDRLKVGLFASWGVFVFYVLVCVSRLTGLLLRAGKVGRNLLGRPNKQLTSY